MSVNKVILIGNLGQDPDIKVVGDTFLATFSLALSEKYKNKGGEQVEKTEWVNCLAWGKLAEIFEKYVKKGHKIYIEGNLKTDSWEKEGIRHYKTSVIIESLQMLTGNKPLRESDPNASPEEADDLPF